MRTERRTGEKRRAETGKSGGGTDVWSAHGGFSGQVIMRSGLAAKSLGDTVGPDKTGHFQTLGSGRGGRGAETLQKVSHCVLILSRGAAKASNRGGIHFSKNRPGLNARSGGRKNTRPLYIRVVGWRFCLDFPENWRFEKIRGILWITFGDKSGRRGMIRRTCGRMACRQLTVHIGMRGRWGHAGRRGLAAKSSRGAKKIGGGVRGWGRRRGVRLGPGRFGWARSGGRAGNAADGLHQPVSLHRFVGIHGVQAGCVEA